MKKTTKKKAPAKKAFKIASKLFLGATFFSLNHLGAEVFTWIGNENDKDNLRNPFSWLPEGVPSSRDTAVFPASAFSATPINHPSGIFEVSSAQFNGAAVYTFKNGGNFGFFGPGILNLGTGTQTFNNNAPGEFGFFNSAGAGVRTIFNLDNSFSFFRDASSADSATFNISRYNGKLNFMPGTTAANGTFNLTDSSQMYFENSSAANSEINIDDSYVEFSRNATAANAKINLVDGAEVDFYDSSAVNALIHVTDSSIYLFKSSSLGNAQVNLNSGYIEFDDTASGSMGAVNLTNSSTLAIYQDNTLGSLAVDAYSSVNLNGYQLEVGSNNLNTTFAGGLMDDDGGSLSKVGTGTLNFSGLNDSSFSGDIDVNGGTFALNGSTGGDIYVYQGGTLSGSGFGLGQVSMNFGGTIAPNNSLSTLTFQNGYNDNSGSTYITTVDPLGNSSLLDTTTASLAGEVVVNTQNGFIPGYDYLIFNATSGITGSFSGATADSLFIIPTLSQDFNNVFLSLATNFSPYVRTSNQANVMGEIDDPANQGPDQTLLLNALGASADPAELQRNLDLLSGNQYTGLIQMAQTAGHRFIRHLYNPVRFGVINSSSEIDCCNVGSGAWVEIGGGRNFLKTDENGFGYHADFFEANLGYYQRVIPNLTLGVALDYERDNMDFTTSGKNQVHVVQGALFAVYDQPLFYALADLIFGYSDSKMSRNVSFNGLNTTARSSPYVYNGILYAEGGFNLHGCNFFLEPFLGLEVGGYHRGGFSEGTAGGAQLTFNKKDHCNFDSRLGIHFTTIFPGSLLLSIDAAWDHKYTTYGDKIHVGFEEFGTYFDIVGVKQQKNGVDGALTLSTNVQENATVYLQASGESWNRFSTWGINGGVVVTW